MKFFRDLYINASADAMEAAVNAMEQALPAGWKRDRNAENRLRAFQMATQDDVYCFTRENSQHRAATMLTLARKDAKTFYVSNIIPLNRNKLERAEYNAILEEFYEHVFRPYAERADVEHEFTGEEAALERWMDARTVDKLKSFSASANRGTGASHPADRARWNGFLLSAYQTRSTLAPSTLERWLVEVEHWPPEIAEQLTLEYESGLGLLAYASSH